MEIKYDNQADKWEECITNKKRNVFSKRWLRKDTLDHWRHRRMLEPIKSFIINNESWLTIGDGRYGTEANFLIENGLNAHATDLSDKLLKIGNEIGFINEYSQENAEELSFDDESFDYILIKESLHHFPRPWIALNEAFRVCRKGVIIIEPNDQLSNGFNLFKRLMYLLKKLAHKRINIGDYNFEEVGNFIYTVNLREIEKFMLGMHYRNIAYIRMNDFYFKGIEEVDILNPKLKDLILKYYLKLIILIRDLLCNLNLSKHSLITIAMLKDAPSKKTIREMNRHNWIFKKLPKNPYKK